MGSAFRPAWMQQTTTTSETAALSRVLCRHDWNSLGEWVAMVDGLADLTDDQIDEVVRCPDTPHR